MTGKKVNMGLYILVWKNWLMANNPGKEKKIMHAAHETIRTLMDFGFLGSTPKNKIEFLEVFEEWLRNNIRNNKPSLYTSIMICYIKHTLDLPFVDDDGNISSNNFHLYRGTNRNIELWPYPCPNCNPSYLGISILTVTVLTADYYEPSYECKNPGCDPIYDEYGNLEDSGAYWCYDDECYYTPQYPRL